MWRTGKASFVVLLLSLHLAAFACIHPPAGFPGRVTEREKLAFLFHDGTNAHLVIRTTLASDSGLPERMAWVIPVPALPSKYEEAPAELFSELARLIPRVRQRPKPMPANAKAAPMAKAKAPAIRIHETQVVGSYTIQPVEILSESAGGELNAWLRKNGFDPVPPENQKFYLKRGAVFLALRVDGLKGSESGLKPLHIVYRDDRMRLPLKFSSHSGVFDVRLYALTEQPPSRKALEDYGLRVSDASYKINEGLAERAPAVAKLVGASAGYVTEFTGERYNLGRPVTELSEDPWLTRTGSARGGEPGGTDNAGIMPAYPLLRVAIPPERGSVWPESIAGWVGLAFMTAWLVAALGWLVHGAWQLAGIVRTRESYRWRRFGNRTMLAALALCLLSIPLPLFSMAFGMWGLVPEMGPWVLFLTGLGLFAIGLLLRIAAVWADIEEPAKT
jgi:uncharacterized protein DUF2330